MKGWNTFGNKLILLWISKILSDLNIWVYLGWFVSPKQKKNMNGIAGISNATVSHSWTSLVFATLLTKKKRIRNLKQQSKNALSQIMWSSS